MSLIAADFVLGAVLGAVSPAPGEVVSTPPEELITPGTIGFLATFAVAVALFFLVRDMNRRVQRIQVRGERADGRRRADGGAGRGGDGVAGDPHRPEDPDTSGHDASRG